MLGSLRSRKAAGVEAMERARGKEDHSEIGVVGGRGHVGPLLSFT